MVRGFFRVGHISSICPPQWTQRTSRTGGCTAPGGAAARRRAGGPGPYPGDEPGRPGGSRGRSAGVRAVLDLEPGPLGGVSPLRQVATPAPLSQIQIGERAVLLLDAARL